MVIESYLSPYLSSFMYVVRENHRAIVIDPYPCDLITSDQLAIDMVLLTHEHFDHISGVNALRAKHACPVLCAETCATRLGNPRKNMSAYFDVFTSIPEFKRYSLNATYVEPYSCKADCVMSEDLPLQWAGHVVSLLYTPGHTIGSACYLLDDKFLFSGDSLFADIETLTRFPSGSMEAFKASAHKLLPLNENVIVLPGHFKRFTLGERKDYLKQIAEVK